MTFVEGVNASEPWVLWDMVDGRTPRGLIGLGDPDVHRIDGRGVMFLGGFSSRFRNRLYQASLPPGRDLADASWTFPTSRFGVALPLVGDPPRGAWDSGGMHTPTYVPPAGGHPARLYYTGRATSRQYGPGSQYSIGVLERRGGGWVRRDAPIITGDASRPSVLEPCVVHADGRYVMWYLANPHEIGPGDQPDNTLRVTESEDGIGDWTPPRTFAGPEEGFFDNAVVRQGDRWVMLLARGSNLHGTEGFPAQGLWWTTSPTLVGERAAWSPLSRLADTDHDDTPAWCARGVYSPSLAFVDTASTRARVFFTATRDAPPWRRLALQQLASRRRPPLPAPFYLSVGAVDLDLGPSHP